MYLTVLVFFIDKVTLNYYKNQIVADSVTSCTLLLAFSVIFLRELLYEFQKSAFFEVHKVHKVTGSVIPV